MTPQGQEEERNALILEAKEFKEKMKDRGIAAQHGLWNMTATTLSVVLTAASIIKAIDNNTNSYLVYSVIFICCLGIYFVWRCYKHQKDFYETLVSLAQGAIDTKGGNNTKTNQEDTIRIVNWQVTSEKITYYLLACSLIGLVLILAVPTK